MKTKYAETISDFFYITSLDEWAIFAGEIINKLRGNSK